MSGRGLNAKGRSMNFPTTQRTGRLAELRVEEVFTAWSWTVGKDHIDTGYDFFVQPDVTTFKGHRFLVQVKATSCSKHKQVAKVSKSRLREYAANPLPVFLVWSGTDDVLHWLHIQPWIRRNADRLAGSGNASVKLLPSQRLDNQEAFTSYLSDILKPAPENSTALPDLARERSRYLSSIDPRLAVRVGVNDGRESYEISASTETTPFRFEITFLNHPNSREGLLDAIRYGLPVTIDVDRFHMKGSDLFAAIGLGNLRGIFSIQPMERPLGNVTVCPGTHYSILAPTYALRATLYQGTDGAAVSNTGLDDILDFNMRVSLDDTGKSRVNLTMGLRDDRIGSAAIQHLDSLGKLGDCAYEAMQQRSLHFDLSFGARRVPLIVRDELLDTLTPVLNYMFVLGRLQKVARALNSGLVVDREFALSEKDIADIDFAYWLLKGERLHVNLGTLEFDSRNPIEPGSKGDFYIRSALEFVVSGRPLGSIPVAILLRGYALERRPLQQRYHLVKGEGAEEVIYYDDHCSDDVPQ